jgi:hypothetical protein
MFYKRVLQKERATRGGCKMDREKQARDAISGWESGGGGKQKEKRRRT